MDGRRYVASGSNRDRAVAGRDCGNQPVHVHTDNSSIVRENQELTTRS